MSGDVVGNVFDVGWEQRPEIDTCIHHWETVRYQTRPGADIGTVEKCFLCGAPRCGRANDSGYCVDRRHHDSLHIFPDGEFQPFGGVLPAM